MYVIVRDSFDRANNATSLGTADSGQTYTQIGQGGNIFGISSNKAYYSAPNGDNSCGYINCGTPDVRMTVTLRTSTTNSNSGLAARITDVGNYIGLQFVNVGATIGIFLTSNVAFTGTQICGTPLGTVALATTYQVEWTMQGTNHTVKVDGVTMVSGSASTPHDAVTNHGLWIYCAGGSTDSAEVTWENLLITDSNPAPIVFRF